MASVARWIAVVACALLSTSRVPAAELQIVLPLGRTAYQTNEWIDVSVVRASLQPLPAGPLDLMLLGDDGSVGRFAFSLPAVPVVGQNARATEHLHLNGRLLRPGHYVVNVTADGVSARTAIDVFSHVRKTSYRLVNWGRAQGKEQLVEGEDSLGFNLIYGHYAADDEALFLRAGVDFMACCTMSGGHQMDLRQECDWSDPYVIRGGTQRAVRRAFLDRTRPNVVGVHFYDEPGLTWEKDPRTGEMTPHAVPSQLRAYKAAFGEERIDYRAVRPDNPQDAARWRQWALWKLGFMDAAWRDAQFGVSWVRPDYLSLTQTQYGFSAFTDGIYFNASRCLPITSGHGGYDDYGLGYFNPAYTLEMGRARDIGKPCWYLPTWYGNTPSDRYRLEQYACFMTNIQGMICPPDIDPFKPETKPGADGVVETNKLMARLGPIFTTMPVTRPPVAMLYSMSHNIGVQTGDMNANYAHANEQGLRLPLVYLAGKMLQQQFMPVVDEDLIDGTISQHKAVILTSVDHLDPRAVAALEAFGESGGLVLLTADCKVKIRGAIDLGVVPDLPDAKIVRQLWKEGKYGDAAKYCTVGKQYEGAAPLAKAIKAQLDRRAIHPVFYCDQPGITAARQSAGDFEYLFALNTTYDPAAGGMNAIRPVEATLQMSVGQTVYDAVLGGPADWPVVGKMRSRKFRFGPGQLRVFCRPARPIGSIRAMEPLVRRDLTSETQPLAVELAAVLLDTQGRPLSGSAPVEIRVLDPLGGTRYWLYRATEQGTLRLTLPLAANDPAGDWKVIVRDLLANTEDAMGFSLLPPAQWGAMAGATPRAVMFGNERENVFRFFRIHHDVKLVVGTSPFHAAAAARIAESLKPWGVHCEVVGAATVNHPRELSADEARTWVGLEFGRVKPGKENSVGHVGFDIRGPVILLGNPADNPLIDYAQKQRFLPYKVVPDVFPGRGRGMIAWQRDAVGIGQESLVLIAYDEAGMNEAVGTLYEAAAGIEPLTRWTLPDAGSVRPAFRGGPARELKVVWQTALPDRAAAMKAEAGRVTVLTLDGSLIQLDPAGKITGQQVIEPAQIAKLAVEMKPAADRAAMALAQKTCPSDRIVKFALAQGPTTAVGYWGGTLVTLAADGSRQTVQVLPQDIAALAVLDGRWIIALADGRVLALETHATQAP